MQQGKSFTIRHKAIVNSIRSECGICQAYDPLSGLPHPDVKPFIGLWDTGATGSVITKKVVDSLGLKPAGKVKTLHANGEAIVDTYFINMFLPNQVAFKFLRVTEGILGDIDVLIGMDIIANGDFAITNFAGQTTFSFRVPSCEETDFARQVVISKPIVHSAKPAMNDPCPCGSGKKYKRCHGKR